MSSGNRCEVTGFAELDAQLANLSTFTDDEIADALMAGAKVIGDEERRHIRSVTGNLRASIVEEMHPTNLPADGRTVYIGPRIGKGGPDGWYGYYVEVGHGDVPAHPFVRPAVDLKGGTALGVVMRALANTMMEKAR